VLLEGEKPNFIAPLNNGKFTFMEDILEVDGK
jgi:hypothetical protein